MSTEIYSKFNVLLSGFCMDGILIWEHSFGNILGIYKVLTIRV